MTQTIKSKKRVTGRSIAILILGSVSLIFGLFSLILPSINLVSFVCSIVALSFIPSVYRGSYKRKDVVMSQLGKCFSIFGLIASLFSALTLAFIIIFLFIWFALIPMLIFLVIMFAPM